MKKLLLGAALLTTLALFPAPALADGGFSLYGSYWDTDEADETFGGGVTLAIPVGEVLGIELRASYFEELSDEPFENLFDSDDVFEPGLQVLPLDLGLRFDFNNAGAFQPYVAGGLSYYLLDSDFGDVDDEAGFYLALGGVVGQYDRGPYFFAEILYRQAEVTVEVDPEDFDDVDDIDFEDGVDVDLNGVGANVGIAWRW